MKEALLNYTTDIALCYSVLLRRTACRLGASALIPHKSEEGIFELQSQSYKLCPTTIVIEVR